MGLNALVGTDSEYHPRFLFTDDGMLIKNISLPSVLLYIIVDVAFVMCQRMTLKIAL